MTEEILLELPKWSLLYDFDSNLFAIKTSDNRNDFYLYDTDGYYYDSFSARGILRRDFTLINDYETKASAIEVFEDVSSNHTYGEDYNYFYYPEDEDYEEE